MHGENAILKAILKVVRAGVGFGSGTETSTIYQIGNLVSSPHFFVLEDWNTALEEQTCMYLLQCRRSPGTGN